MVDLLPAQIQYWQHVESVARDYFRKASLNEIRTPILESTDLFARGIGEGTDVVGKEMYSFFDRGNRSCTLRPEGTASVVRAIIQSGLVNQLPQRLWYMGPMFRYERPQAGRQRQFHQIGVELFGVNSVDSDAELITIGWDFLRNIGLENLTLELNSLGTIEDRKNFRSMFVSWLENRIDLLDEDSKGRLTTNPLRIFDTKNSQTRELLLSAPSLLDALCKESLERFEGLQENLNHLQIPFKVNPGLVRGLDYYCHTAFEITSKQLGAQATICGGGRYNGLVKQLGGPDTPAIGWAVGLERLILILNEDLSSQEISSDIYIVNKGQGSSKHALSISRQLRTCNFSVQIDYSGSAFSKQFKRANRSGSCWALILGEDELRKGVIKLKRLKGQGNPNDLEFELTELDQLTTFLNQNL